MTLLKTLLEWDDPPLHDFYLMHPIHSRDKRHFIERQTFINDYKGDIKRYTGDESTRLNEALWKTKLEGIKPTDRDIHTIKRINNDINTQNYPEDLNVYTGIHHQDTQAEIARNDIVHIPSFLSTSIDSHVAHDFAVHHGGMEKHKTAYMIKIHLPANSFNGSFVGHISANKEENEFLVPSNKLLKINGHEVHEDGAGRKVKIYHASIMNHDEIQANKDHPEVQSYLKMKELLK